MGEIRSILCPGGQRLPAALGDLSSGRRASERSHAPRTRIVPILARNATLAATARARDQPRMSAAK